MSIYDSLKTVASNIIRQYGGAITLNSVPAPSYDSATGRPYWMVDGSKTYTAPSATQHSGYAVIRKPRIDEIQGSAIMSTDTVFVAVGIPQPRQGDTITSSGVDYRVNEVHLTKPDGETDIVFTVYGRA